MTLLVNAGDLPAIGKRLTELILDTDQARQVLAIAEEAGEFVGAYNRWSGRARRIGTREEMEDELADVIVTAFVTAHVFGMDIENVIARKLHVILHRGVEGT